MDPLSDLLWHEHRTVLVYGNVTRAVWDPPVGQGFGVLMAPDEVRAREALEKILRLKALSSM